MGWKHVIRNCVLALVIGMAAFIGVADINEREMTETHRLQGELETLKQVNRGLAAKNRRLERNLEALKTNPLVLEQAAREDFGYIRDGEIVVVLPE